MINTLKKTFIFLYDKDVAGAFKPIGSGFFTSVASVTKPDEFFLYIATAKHVLQVSEIDTSFVDVVFVRLNTLDGKSKYLPLFFKNSPHLCKVFQHPDPDIDLVVIQVRPDQSVFEFKCIPDEMLVTREMFKRLQIKEGDQVFFGGLFTHFDGVKRNIPIVRYGAVAMISDEKISTNEGQALDLYLMDVKSDFGNSGAPVFFNLKPKPGLSHPDVYLAGVLKGGYPGFVTAVVPSYYLHEIIHGPEATEIRTGQGH